MSRAGYLPSEVEETLAFLRDRNYLDDEAFARQFARRAATDKYWGPARIEQGLRKRDLSESHIAAALKESFTDGESAAARRALQRFRRLDRRRDQGLAGRARAYRHLLSRGYSASVAYSLLEEDFPTDEDGS